MNEIKKEVNSKIDWIGGTEKEIFDEGNTSIETVMHNENETLLDARKHYFEMMRRFLDEVHSQAQSAGFVQITAIFKKYDIHFVDVDDFPRINIDEPKKEN